MRTWISVFVALAYFAVGASLDCQAQQLVQIDWGGTTGAQAWHTGGNWVGGVAPHTAVPDPSLQIANLAVNLGAGLTVDLGATDARIAQLKMGSLSSAVTTNVVGTGKLIFENNDISPITATEDADFDNNGRVEGRDFLIWQRGFSKTGVNLNGSGDANGDQVVDGADLTIWQDQYGLGQGLFRIGMPGIESTGAAGATNLVTAPIHIVNEQLGVGGTRNLTIAGAITYEGDPASTPVAGFSSSSLSAISAGQTVTLTSNFNLVDTNPGTDLDALTQIDFRFNSHGESRGTIVADGVISGDGDLMLGVAANGIFLPLGTVRLNKANTYTGGTSIGRGNVVVDNDAAFGTGLVHINGPNNQVGFNLRSTSDARNIANPVRLGAWLTAKGDNSLTLSGPIEMTNNRGVISMLPANKALTLSGRVNIWEEEEDGQEDQITVRRFAFDGSGKTVVSGPIRNSPDDFEPANPELRQLIKSGTGALVISMANAGDNNHSGRETVIMGNMHYANNNSLNAHSSAQILSLGGAVGVDDHPPGQNLGTNTAFLNQIDTGSRGGLMLSATEDAATNLDFTSGALANAANMSVAAPETGINYTGTITPAGSKYMLGGGVGTLTLPNAQLSGGNSVEIKNGGKVSLLGDNTYSGGTAILTKYTSGRQEIAAADEMSDGDAIFYDKLVAPILEIDDLANGGAASSIGSSTNAAANLKLQGATLRYVGTGDSSDRLFTIGTGGGTLDSSGSGAVVFSNTGALAVADAADHIGTLDDFAGNPNEVVNVDDTSDVIIGMTISDPDTGGPVAAACGGGTSRNCIPAGTTVTGVSDNGKSIGLSTSFGFIWKQNTRLVFGTVDRTLTLTGTNAQANILSATIADSAKGGKVNILKQGTGTWLLEGVSTSTGTTTVEAGTLGGNGGVGGALAVNAGATFAPGGTGASAIGDFSVGGSFTLNSGAIMAMQLGGTAAGSFDKLNVTGAAILNGVLNLSAVAFSPAVGNQFTLLTATGGITDNGLTISGLTGFTKSIVGNSLVLTKSAALSALASVPEPSALVLLGLAMAFVGVRRK